jgi:hypothetical protein
MCPFLHQVLYDPVQNQAAAFEDQALSPPFPYCYSDTQFIPNAICNLDADF